MKKVFAALALALAAFAFSQQEQGISANVELFSGTKQRAQFLGIENDTVKLGGYIKNQFTVVRIHKDKFKSILDDNGNDLLAPPAPVANDSSVAVADSTAPDSAATDSIAEEPLFSSSTVLVAYENTTSDSTLSAQMTALTARLLLEGNEQVHVLGRSDISECNDDICLQNTLHKKGAKTIYNGKITSALKPDSITLELSRITFEENLPEVHKAKLTLSKKTAFSDAIANNRMQNLILSAKNIPLPESAPKNSYIMVDTDPEGATLSRPEKDAICRTPCTFVVTDTGKVEVNAYWNVESQLWGAQSFVRPIPGDTAKISLRLKPISPEVHVITTPSETEVFPGSAEITKHSKSIGKSPTKFPLNEPGMANITLRHIGYKDTVVSFYVAPVNEIRLNVEMEKLTDYNEIAKQKEWQHDRRMSRVGHALMAGAIAPVIISAIFVYLGSQDYDDAKAIKDELRMPGSAKGENYQQKVKKNKDLVDDGDKKMIIGASLAGAGVLLFGVGLFLSF